MDRVDRFDGGSSDDYTDEGVTDGIWTVTYHSRNAVLEVTPKYVERLREFGKALPYSTLLLHRHQRNMMIKNAPTVTLEMGVDMSTSWCACGAMKVGDGKWFDGRRFKAPGESICALYHSMAIGLWLSIALGYGTKLLAYGLNGFKGPDWFALPFAALYGIYYLRRVERALLDMCRRNRGWTPPPMPTGPLDPHDE